MELKQLRYFVQIADSGNFTKASEILRISQPSLSQQIMLLEAELQVTLMKRHARGVTLTDRGKQLYEYATRTLMDVDQVKETLASGRNVPRGRVSVGLPTSACRGLSVQLHRAINEKLPNIKLHIVEAMSGYLDDILVSGKIDVALRYTPSAAASDSEWTILKERLCVIVDSQHHLAVFNTLDINDVLKLPLTLPSKPNAIRSLIEDIAHQRGDRIEAYSCDSLSAIVGMVRQRHYATIMPQFALSEELNRGELWAISISDPKLCWSLSLVKSETTLNQCGSIAVMEVLRDLIKDMVIGNTWHAELYQPSH